jgi:hypothetical protein
MRGGSLEVTSLVGDVLKILYDNLILQGVEPRKRHVSSATGPHRL